ncbi:fap1 adhesin [Drosophila tropicalis]|uniref:fap1 adhesin n=1 Tax=Drosophila tropicalis TaxID=46794 RepID=UPI0035AB6FDB
MFLDGAQLCYVDKDGVAVSVAAKGRTFQIGSSMGCDLLLTEDYVDRLLCEINCDAFGRVTIHNHSKKHTVQFNEEKLEGKRPLLHGTRLTILDIVYTWEFPNSLEAEPDNGVEPSGTPNRNAPLVEQAPNSCPSLRTDQEPIEKRFTVHNFKYAIKSDDEGNTSLGLKDLSDVSERCVSPSNETDSSIIDDDTPKVDLLESTQNKENTSSPPGSHKKLLQLCSRSDVVVTSFSPRTTGVRIEKSFTCVMKPQTPKSVYGTPKSVLSEVNEDSCSRDLVDFSTPSTSKNAGVRRMSSMYLIDLTTPQRLKSTPRQTTPSTSSDSSEVIEVSSASTPPSVAKSRIGKNSKLLAAVGSGATPKRTPQSLMKRALLTSAKKKILERTPINPSLSNRSSLLGTTPRRLPFDEQRKCTPEKRVPFVERRSQCQTSPRKRKPSLSLSMSCPRDNKLSQQRKSLAESKRNSTTCLSNKLVAKARRSLSSRTPTSPKVRTSQTPSRANVVCSTPEQKDSSAAELSRTFTIDDDEDESMSDSRGKERLSFLTAKTVRKDLNPNNSTANPIEENGGGEQSRSKISNNTFNADEDDAAPTANPIEGNGGLEQSQSNKLNETFNADEHDEAPTTNEESTETNNKEGIIEDNMADEVLMPIETNHDHKGDEINKSLNSMNIIEDTICDEVEHIASEDELNNVEEPAPPGETPMPRRSSRRFSSELTAPLTPRRSVRRASMEASQKLSQPKRRASCSAMDPEIQSVPTPKRQRRVSEEFSTPKRQSKRLLSTPKRNLPVDDAVGDMAVIVEAQDEGEGNTPAIADEDYGTEVPMSTASDEMDKVDYHGLKDLLKTPKMCSTPRYKGLREMMKTPRMPASPILDNINELMEEKSSATIVRNIRLEVTAEGKDLDKILKTPSAKNIMIPNDPASAILKSREDSLATATEYDLNVTNTTLHLDKIFEDIPTKSSIQCPEDSENELSLAGLSAVTAGADPLGTSQKNTNETVSSEILMNISVPPVGNSLKDPLTSTAYKSTSGRDEQDPNEREPSRPQSPNVSGIHYLDETTGSMFSEPLMVSCADTVEETRNNTCVKEKGSSRLESANVSGVHCLDETTGSTFSEPLMVSDVDTEGVTRRNTTINVKSDDSIHVDSDTESTIGLSEPLVVSDDEDEEVNKTANGKVLPAEESIIFPLDEKTVINDSSNTKDKSPIDLDTSLESLPLDEKEVVIELDDCSESDLSAVKLPTESDQSTSQPLDQIKDDSSICALDSTIDSEREIQSAGERQTSSTSTTKPSPAIVISEDATLDKATENDIDLEIKSAPQRENDAFNNSQSALKSQNEKNSDLSHHGNGVEEQLSVSVLNESTHSTSEVNAQCQETNLSSAVIKVASESSEESLIKEVSKDINVTVEKESNELPTTSIDEKTKPQTLETDNLSVLEDASQDTSAIIDTASTELSTSMPSAEESLKETTKDIKTTDILAAKDGIQTVSPPVDATSRELSSSPPSTERKSISESIFQEGTENISHTVYTASKETEDLSILEDNTKNISTAAGSALSELSTLSPAKETLKKDTEEEKESFASPVLADDLKLETMETVSESKTQPAETSSMWEPDQLEKGSDEEVNEESPKSEIIAPNEMSNSDEAIALNGANDNQMIPASTANASFELIDKKPVVMKLASAERKAEDQEIAQVTSSNADLEGSIVIDLDESVASEAKVESNQVETDLFPESSNEETVSLDKQKEEMAKEKLSASVASLDVSTLTDQPNDESVHPSEEIVTTTIYPALKAANLPSADDAKDLPRDADSICFDDSIVEEEKKTPEETLDDIALEKASINSTKESIETSINLLQDVTKERKMMEETNEKVADSLTGELTLDKSAIKLISSNDIAENVLEGPVTSCQEQEERQESIAEKTVGPLDSSIPYDVIDKDASDDKRRSVTSIFDISIMETSAISENVSVCSSQIVQKTPPRPLSKECVINESVADSKNVSSVDEVIDLDASSICNEASMGASPTDNDSVVIKDNSSTQLYPGEDGQSSEASENNKTKAEVEDSFVNKPIQAPLAQLQAVNGEVIQDDEVAIESELPVEESAAATVDSEASNEIKIATLEEDKKVTEKPDLENKSNCVNEKQDSLDKFKMNSEQTSIQATENEIQEIIDKAEETEKTDVSSTEKELEMAVLDATPEHVEENIEKEKLRQVADEEKELTLNVISTEMAETKTEPTHEPAKEIAEEETKSKIDEPLAEEKPIAKLDEISKVEETESHASLNNVKVPTTEEKTDESIIIEEPNRKTSSEKIMSERETLLESVEQTQIEAPPTEGKNKSNSNSEKEKEHERETSSDKAVTESEILHESVEKTQKEAGPTEDKSNSETEQSDTESKDITERVSAAMAEKRTRPRPKSATERKDTLHGEQNAKEEEPSREIKTENVAELKADGESSVALQSIHIESEEQPKGLEGKQANEIKEQTKSGILEEVVNITEEEFKQKVETKAVDEEVAGPAKKRKVHAEIVTEPTANESDREVFPLTTHKAEKSKADEAPVPPENDRPKRRERKPSKNIRDYEKESGLEPTCTSPEIVEAEPKRHARKPSEDTAQTNEKTAMEAMPEISEEATEKDFVATSKRRVLKSSEVESKKPDTIVAGEEAAGSVQSEDKPKRRVRKASSEVREPAHPLSDVPKRRGRKPSSDVPECDNEPTQKAIQRVAEIANVKSVVTPTKRRGRKPSTEVSEPIQEDSNLNDDEKLSAIAEDTDEPINAKNSEPDRHTEKAKSRRGRKPSSEAPESVDLTQEDVNPNESEKLSAIAEDTEDPVNVKNSDAYRHAEKAKTRQGRKPSAEASESVEDISEHPKPKDDDKLAAIAEDGDAKDSELDRHPEKAKTRRGRKPSAEASESVDLIQEDANPNESEKLSAIAEVTEEPVNVKNSDADRHPEKAKTRRGRKPSAEISEAVEDISEHPKLKDDKKLSAIAEDGDVMNSEPDRHPEKAKTRRGRKPSAEISDAVEDISEHHKPNDNDKMSAIAEARDEPVSEKNVKSDAHPEKARTRRGRKPSAEVEEKDSQDLPVPKLRRGRKASADIDEMIPPKDTISKRGVIKETAKRHADEAKHLDEIQEIDEPEAKRKLVVEKETTSSIRRRGNQSKEEQEESKPKRRGRKESAEEVRTEATQVEPLPQTPSVEVETRPTRRARNPSVSVEEAPLKKTTTRRGRTPNKQVYESSNAIVVSPAILITEPPLEKPQTIVSDGNQISSEDELTPRRRERRNLMPKNYNETSDEDKPSSRKTRKPAVSKSASKPLEAERELLLSTPQPKQASTAEEPLTPVNAKPPVEPSTSKKRQVRNTPRKDYKEASDDEKPATSRTRRVRNPTPKALELIVDSSPRPGTPKRRKVAKAIAEESEEPPEKKAVTKESALSPEIPTSITAEAASVSSKARGTRRKVNDVKVPDVVTEEPIPAAAPKRNARARKRKTEETEPVADQPVKSRRGGRAKTPAFAEETTPQLEAEPDAKKPPARGRGARAAAAKEPEIIVAHVVEAETSASTSSSSQTHTAPVRSGRARKVHFEAEPTTNEDGAPAPKRATRSRRK